MFVTVHLREDVARELPQNGVQSPDTSSLLHTLAQRGVALQALHPGSTDPQLSTHFFASVESESAASDLTRCLLKSPAVLAAYVKPPDAAP